MQQKTVDRLLDTAAQQIAATADWEQDGEATLAALVAIDVVRQNPTAAAAFARLFEQAQEAETPWEDTE